MFCLACRSEPVTPIPFEKTKWSTQKGNDYPFRDQMVDELLYGAKVRSLPKKDIIELLGEPNRTNENHLYYQINQTRIGLWPLHTKTLVIKLSAVDKVEWIKLHE